MAYHRAHGVDTRIVRIFNTYGARMRPRDGRVVPALIGQALAGEPMTVFGDGSQTRSFCYVSDLIDGIYRLLLSDEPEPVNIGNPAELSVLEFARTIREADRHPRARSSSGRCRWTTRRSASPTSRRRRTKLGWEPKVAAGGGARSGRSSTSGSAEPERERRSRLGRDTPRSVVADRLDRAGVHGLLALRLFLRASRAGGRRRVALVLVALEVVGAVTRQTSQSMHCAST